MTKGASREELEAMTVNERLFATGQMTAFDAARAAGDQEGLRKILRSVHVDEPSIRSIVDRTDNSGGNRRPWKA